MEKRLYVVLIDIEGTAQVFKYSLYKPPKGIYLFGFGPYTENEARQWAEEWNKR